MNFSKSLMFIALAGVMFTSCKETASENLADAEDAVVVEKTVALQPETASFSIEGMSCAVGCAATIEKKLAKMDGVQHATVDFDTKTAKVEFDASKLTTENLVEAVETAADGKTYKVADVKSSKDQAMNFQTDPVKKDKKKKSKKEKKSDAEKKDCAPSEGGEKKSCCSKGGSM